MIEIQNYVNWKNNFQNELTYRSNCLELDQAINLAALNSLDETNMAKIKAHTFEGPKEFMYYFKHYGHLQKFIFEAYGSAMNPGNRGPLV